MIPTRNDEIQHWATNLGVTLDEHIEVVLDAMKNSAESLGLAGIIASIARRLRISSGG